jgi:hypothetical protein
VIDAKTGKVFHPRGASINHVDNVHDELLVDDNPSPRRSDFGSLRYSADSRLLVLVGVPDNRPEDRGISWFLWENDALRRLRIVRKPPR